MSKNQGMPQSNQAQNERVQNELVQNDQAQCNQAQNDQMQNEQAQTTVTSPSTTQTTSTHHSKPPAPLNIFTFRKQTAMTTPTTGKKRKPWPKNCAWPEPLWGGEGDMEWDVDTAEGLPLDETAQELIDIKKYMDYLVERGILNEDYTINEEYDPTEDQYFVRDGKGHIVGVIEHTGEITDFDRFDLYKKEDDPFFDIDFDEDDDEEDAEDEEDISDDGDGDVDSVDGDTTEENVDDKAEDDPEADLIDERKMFGIDTFEPTIGEDYWDDGFIVDAWQDDFNYHMNCLKLSLSDGFPEKDPVSFVRSLIGYEFVNENILRQAFTRRAFAIEYGVISDNEELEFLGDSVMGTVVSRIVIEQTANVFQYKPDAPFMSRLSFDEGDLTGLRRHFVSKDYLAERARTLDLEKLILFGTGEEATDSACEDVIEAIIGAVTIDSNWDWDAIETVTDRLLCIQLTHPNEYLKKTYFDIFNSWHQRHFGRMPEYEVYDTHHRRSVTDHFTCQVKFSVPENDQGIPTFDSMTAEGETRSKARELAAEFAYRYINEKGLWLRLEEAHVIPDLENSINQLQELWQKKYIEKPVYEFTEGKNAWKCDCRCNDLHGYGIAEGKTVAKKRASYMLLVMLLQSAGCCEEKWVNKMLRLLSKP